jgi:type I restriction-modification system DNA methylase subunit
LVTLNIFSYVITLSESQIKKIMTVEQILKQCTVQGNIVKLPGIQLERKTYLDVAKKINQIGGKWKGGKVSGFVFEQDPTELLKQIASSEKRNLLLEYQFFETPQALADKLVSLAHINECHRILEPSAGRGALLTAINKVLPGKVIDCYELMDLNQSFLKKIPTASFKGADFIKNDGTSYDRIIANPPFSNNQDIVHIQEMYTLLNPGGCIATISSTHWQHSNNSTEKRFRNWLKFVDALIVPIEAGSFKTSGTNVAASIITIIRHD